jgi:hypothetical protein
MYIRLLGFLNTLGRWEAYEDPDTLNIFYVKSPLSDTQFNMMKSTFLSLSTVNANANSSKSSSFFDSVSYISMRNDNSSSRNILNKPAQAANTSQVPASKRRISSITVDINKLNEAFGNHPSAYSNKTSQVVETERDEEIHSFSDADVDLKSDSNTNSLLNLKPNDVTLSEYNNYSWNIPKELKIWKYYEIGKIATVFN